MNIQQTKQKYFEQHNLSKTQRSAVEFLSEALSISFQEAHIICNECKWNQNEFPSNLEAAQTMLHWNKKNTKSKIKREQNKYKQHLQQKEKEKEKEKESPTKQTKSDKNQNGYFQQSNTHKHSNSNHRNFHKYSDKQQPKNHRISLKTSPSARIPPSASSTTTSLTNTNQRPPKGPIKSFGNKPPKNMQQFMPRTHPIRGRGRGGRVRAPYSSYNAMRGRGNVRGRGRTHSNPHSNTNSNANMNVNGIKSGQRINKIFHSSTTNKEQNGVVSMPICMPLPIQKTVQNNVVTTDEKNENKIRQYVDRTNRYSTPSLSSTSGSEHGHPQQNGNSVIKLPKEYANELSVSEDTNIQIGMSTSQSVNDENEHHQSNNEHGASGAHSMNDSHSRPQSQSGSTSVTSPEKLVVSDKQSAFLRDHLSQSPQSEYKQQQQQSSSFMLVHSEQFAEQKEEKQQKEEEEEEEGVVVNGDDGVFIGDEYCKLFQILNGVLVIGYDGNSKRKLPPHLCMTFDTLLNLANYQNDKILTKESLMEWYEKYNKTKIIYANNDNHNDDDSENKEDEQQSHIFNHVSTQTFFDQMDENDIDNESEHQHENGDNEEKEKENVNVNVNVNVAMDHSVNGSLRERKPTRPPMSFMSSQKQKQQKRKSDRDGTNNKKLVKKKKEFRESRSALNKNAKTFEPKSRSSSVTKSNPNKSRTPILPLTQPTVSQTPLTQTQSLSKSITPRAPISNSKQMQAHVLQLKESQQQSEANQIKQTQINHQKQLKNTTNQRLNELLNNALITPSAQQTIASMQNEQFQQQQQQRQRQQQQQQQQQQLVHAQQQISVSVPPHPSQFSNPSVYKPIIETTAQHSHAQFAQLTSPRNLQSNIQSAQQYNMNTATTIPQVPSPQTLSFQHQNAQRNVNAATNYVVNNHHHSQVHNQVHAQQHQHPQPILIYDKNANQAPLQPINVNALHRSSSLTMSHQSSNGSLPSLGVQPQHTQPQNTLEFVQRFTTNNNGSLPTHAQVQHIQNINNLHLQQQQQRNQSFDSHLIQNNHQLLQ